MSNEQATPCPCRDASQPCPLESELAARDTVIAEMRALLAEIALNPTDHMLTVTSDDELGYTDLHRNWLRRRESMLAPRPSKDVLSRIVETYDRLVAEGVIVPARRYKLGDQVGYAGETWTYHAENPDTRGCVLRRGNTCTEVDYAELTDPPPAEQPDALLAEHLIDAATAKDAPAQPAPYPWGDVDLTGGRVLYGDEQYTVMAAKCTPGDCDHPCENIWEMASDNPDDESTMLAFGHELRPAPFTPAVGQRVRVVSMSHSKLLDRNIGIEFEITQFAASPQYPGWVSGKDTDVWIHPADLMLLDAPQPEPAPEAKPIPAHTMDFDAHAKTVTMQCNDGKRHVYQMTELKDGAKSCVLTYIPEPSPKPRKWRRYTEQEQRGMKPGTKLKLKGGPVLRFEPDNGGWYDPAGCYWDCEQVAQLKARLLSEVKQ